MDPATYDLALYGVPIGLLILGIIEAAKKAGLPTKYAMLAAAFVGAALGALSQLTPAAIHPDYLKGAIVGLNAGLIASGVYSGLAKLTEPPMLTAVSTWQPAQAEASSSALPPAATPAEPPTSSTTP